MTSRNDCSGKVQWLEKIADLCSQKRIRKSVNLCVMSTINHTELQFKLCCARYMRTLASVPRLRSSIAEDTTFVTCFFYKLAETEPELKLKTSVQKIKNPRCSRGYYISPVSTCAVATRLTRVPVKTRLSAAAWHLQASLRWVPANDSPTLVSQQTHVRNRFAKVTRQRRLRLTGQQTIL